MKNRISLRVMLGLIFFLPLILIISLSHGGDVCIHEVWAPTDCEVRVTKIKRGLRFRIFASKQVNKFNMEVSEEKPDKNGKFNNSEGMKGSTSNVQVWYVEWPNLSPDTLYYYVLEVTDKKGCRSHKVGAQWTHVRGFKFHLSKNTFQMEF